MIKPQKIYYDKTNGNLVTSSNVIINTDALYPKVTFGQETLINLQVKDGTNTYTRLSDDTSAEILIDNDYSNKSPKFGLSADNWTLHEDSVYYYINEIDSTFDEVYFNDIKATAGTSTTLNVGEWFS